MASQDDILRMSATVVDGFSNPLKEMVKQLRSFGDYEKTVHKEGAKFVVQHRNAFEDLRKSMKDGAEHIKGVLTPAMVGLGLGAVGAAGAIEKITSSIKEFAGTSRDLDQLNRATGLSYDKIRALQELTERLGGTKAEASEGIQKLADSLEQLQKFNRGPLNQLSILLPKGGEGTKFRNELKAARDEAEALGLTFKELGKIPTIAGKKTILEAMGLPSEWAYYTKEQLDDIEKNITHMSKEQVDAGLQGQKAFDRLRESVRYLKEEIGAGLAPVLAEIVDSIREFVHTHGAQMVDIMKQIANAIRTFDWAGFGQQIRDIVDYFGGWASALKLVVGIAVAAWLAPIVIGVAGLAAAIAAATIAATSFGATALGAAILGGGALAGGALAGLLGSAGDLNKGEDEAARQRKYGIGPGSMGSLSSGPGLELKKGVKEGVFEGMTQAFRDWWNGPGGAEGGAGGGGAGGAGTGLGRGQRSLMNRGGGGGKVGGSLRENQGEAYQAAIAAGYSPEAAKAIVANISGESLANPANTNMNDGQYAAGMVQWDKPRSDAITKQFGKAPQNMSIAEQMKAMKWEIDNNPRFARTKSALAGGGSSESMLDTLVRNYEAPKYPDADVRKRSGFLGGLGDVGSRGPASTSEAAAAASAGRGVAQSGKGAADFASSMRGLKDHDPKGHALIAEYLQTGGAGMDPATINWCASFVSASFAKAGIAGPEAANVATSWAKWGSHVDPKYARRGDVLVTMRGRRPGQVGGHVGIVTGSATDAGIPVVEGDVRASGGGHMVSTDVERIRAGLEVRRPPSLDRSAREHQSMNHTVTGRAGVDIKLAGFPRGTQVASRAEGIFHEVKLVRGNMPYSNRDVG
jgi:uncharacterized protein (TIGR02594 family)